MEFLNIKQAKKTIGLIAANGRKLDERIHTVGCSGLYHFQEHQDTTILTDLVKAMPKSSRGNALKYWITQHSNVKWSKKAFGGEGGFVKDGQEVQVDLAHAVEHPFYEKTDTEQSAFNPDSRVKSFIKAFQKAIEKGEITREDFEAYKQQILEA